MLELQILRLGLVAASRTLAVLQGDNVADVTQTQGPQPSS